MTPGSVARAIPTREGFSVDLLLEKSLALIQVFRPGDGWFAVGLLALNLMTIVWSVQRADWVATPNLAYLILLGLLTSLLLFRIPIWAVLLLPVGAALGLLIVVWQITSFQAEGMQLASAAELWERLDLWWSAAKAGTINIDQVPFAFGLMSATWLSGYLAGWVFFRYRNFWGVFILGGAGILSNLTYLPDTASVDLAIYLFSALLLVGRVQAVRRRQEWRRRNFQYDGHLGWLALSDTILIGLAVMILAYLLPVGRSWDPANGVYEVGRSPLLRWEEDFNRLFAGLPARRAMPYRIWGDSLAFQGTINPTNNPVLQVNSPVPMYWKARTYGTYTPKGWVSSGTVLKEIDWTPSYSAPHSYLQRFEVNYTVTPNYASKNLFAGGQVISVDQDAQVETYDSPSYTIDFQNPSLSSVSHPTLLLAALNLERSYQLSGGSISDSAIEQELPDGLALSGVKRDQGVLLEVTLAEVLPELPDSLSLRATGAKIKKGQTYQITSSVSLASPDELRRAGVNYPIWATEKYTQLPPELPQRVHDLAQRWTAGYSTPYDKAKAIESNLKTFNYNLVIDPPPYQADGVDYFLFDLREGYSEYFGSAMTVLLRSQGIPARLATGYTVGDKVRDQEIYIVNDSHSHAWVEAFFPGYGWIAFEPTPGELIPLAVIPVPRSLDAEFGENQDDLDLLCEDDAEDCDEGAGDLTPGGIGQDETLASLGQRLTRAFPWIIGLTTLIALTAGAGWIFWRRYLASSGDPQITFRQLAFLGGLNSVGLASHQTPYQYQEQLAEAFPAQRAQVSTIVNSYVRSQYGKKEMNQEEREGLLLAWLKLRVVLMLHVFRRRNLSRIEN